MQLDFISSQLNSYSSIRRFAVVLGCLLGLLALSSDAGNVIGYDSILYIQTAAIYNKLGLQAAWQGYNWPVYPIIIAIVHSLTSLSLINSAYFINLLFVLLMADAFYRLYWELFPESKIRWLPVVIFLAYTGINDYRDEIVRDWGYWAFALLTLLYFLRAYNHARLGDYILWQLCALLALLFRLEAVIFMLMLPLLFLLPKLQFLKFMLASSIFWCLGIILLLYLGFNGDIGSAYWGRLEEVLSFFTVVDLWAEFKQDSLEHALQIFSHNAKGHAVLFMLSGLMGVLLVKLIAKTGVIYLFIGLAGGYLGKVKIEKKTLFLILFMVFITLFPVAIFFAKTKILTGRYVIFTILILLLLLTFYVEQLIIYCQDNQNKHFLLGLAALITLNLIIGIVHSKPGKSYLKELGLWTDQHIPQHASVFANDIKLCFYSQRQAHCHQHVLAKDKILTNKILVKYDYLLWRDHDQEDRIKRLQASGKLQRLYVVPGSKSGAQAVLYQIIKD